MLPALAAGGIQAVGQLGQALFGAAAARKKQEREIAAQKEQQARGLQTQGIQSLSAGQQAAFQNLMQNFGRSLGV